MRNWTKTLAELLNADLMSDDTVQEILIYWSGFAIWTTCQNTPTTWVDLNALTETFPHDLKPTVPRASHRQRGKHTSLGKVFLWVFPTQSIVTRNFTKQLNHERKMIWKWGTSEEEGKPKVARDGNGKRVMWNQDDGRSTCMDNLIHCFTPKAITTFENM